MSHKCCVLECEELVKETRAKGLPLHKFPKDPLLRAKWLTSGGFPPDFKPTNSQIVCYKHFKQGDYEIGRSHKLFLKKGSVPTVFTDYQNHPDPIGPDSHLIAGRLQAKLTAAAAAAAAASAAAATVAAVAPTPVPASSQLNAPTQPADLPDVSSGPNLDSSCSSFDASMDSSCSLPNGQSLSKPVPAAAVAETQPSLAPDPPELTVPTAAASTSQNCSLDPAQASSPVPLAGLQLQQQQQQPHSSHQQPHQTPTSLSPTTLALKRTLNTPNKLRTYSRTDLTFLPGSKLEAKDFNEKWYSARVVETDWGEREVLIHFDKWSSRFDEWIPMDSSRLRTLQLHSKEAKPKQFSPGERILATWVDGKKYPAKVNAALGNDRYDVLFDDGYSKALKASKMTKLLEMPPAKQEEDNNYLGSKQERRDKKRKHTVTELFQHKKKVQPKSEHDKVFKKQDQTDVRNIKSLPKMEADSQVKTETLPRLDSHQNIVNPVPVDEDYATYIGNLRVEIEDSTYKCPKTGCNKNFRKENLLQMHIKHYHPEYSKFMGSTPNVADLAYARTIGESIEDLLPKKAKITSQMAQYSHGIGLPVPQTADTEFAATDFDNRLENKFSAESNASTLEDNSSEQSNSCTMSPGRLFDMRSKEDKAHTGIKTLPPVRHPTALGTHSTEHFSNIVNDDFKSISTNDKVKAQKKRQQQLFSESSSKVKVPRGILENEEGYDQYDDSLLDGDDIPDYKCHSTSNGRAEPENEIHHSKSGDIMIINGEVIKVEKLKREEIINCTCGITEEDGLMIQCDLCLCWQHGHCNAIEKEKDVPEKYVCYICQHSHKQRASKKYFHDQDWIKEGKLPSIYNSSTNKEKINERTAIIKRSFDLDASLLQTLELLHSLRVKINIAQKKDHPKLYLWAKNWSKIEVPIFKTEPVPIMEVIKNEVCKTINENVNDNLESNFPTKLEADQKLITSDTELMQILEEDSQAEDSKSLTKNFTPYNCRDGGRILLDALTKNETGGQDQQLASTKSEINNGDSPMKQNSKHVMFEKSNKMPLPSNHSGNKSSIMSQPVVPEPEAPIDPVECKLRLLQHIDNCQNYVESRLSFVETQLSALEDISANENHNSSHVRTKQTIQMLLHDLESMQKLAALC